MTFTLLLASYFHTDRAFCALALEFNCTCLFFFLHWFFKLVNNGLITEHEEKNVNLETYHLYRLSVDNYCHVHRWGSLIRIRWVSGMNAPCHSWFLLFNSKNCEKHTKSQKSRKGHTVLWYHTHIHCATTHLNILFFLVAHKKFQRLVIGSKIN